MMLQPFDDPLMVIGHGRGRRVVHVLEDGVKHRAGTLHEPLNMLFALAVDVREEEKLLISLEHETGEVHGTEVVLRFRKIGHQRGQLFGERLGVGRTLDREVKDEMTLTHSVLLGLSDGHFVLRIRASRGAARGRSGERRRGNPLPRELTTGFPPCSRRCRPSRRHPPDFRAPENVPNGL